MDTTGNIQLRRSKRLQDKNDKCPKKEDYVEHIHTLHSVASDLHDMADALTVEELKNIIEGYENIIGLLLNVE